MFDSKILCCLHDKVAKKYYAPSCFDNDDCAVRDGEILFKEHFDSRSPDFEIVKVGAFYPDKGVICSVEPVVLLKGSDIVVE